MDDGTSTPFRPPAFAAAMAAPRASAAGPPVAIGGATGSETSPFGLLTASPTGSSAPVLPPPIPSGICVFSGGTAANSLVDAFQAVVANLSSSSPESHQRKSKTKQQPCHLTYIIPISDNGGSSSELIRFFGGPSVGDIRSRLVRLIPTSYEEDDDDDDDENVEEFNGATDSGDTGHSLGPPRPQHAAGGGHHSGGHHSTNERAALRALFEYRLCATDPVRARAEWLDIVEARHLLWTCVPSPTRELIRAVLNTLNLEIVKRARPTSVFNFAAASVGNLFLTGARLFSGSFEAAIYLLSLVCGIPDHVAVLPAINSNFTHHISAGLADGTTIAGQVNISHPSAPTSLPDGGGQGGGDPVPWPALLEAQGDQAQPLPDVSSSSSPPPPSSRRLHTRQRAATAVDFEDATLPGSLPALRRPQIAFSKDDEEDLAARIARIWYINPYGHEIRPQANSKVVASLRQARAVVYSIGSLYTSIIPSLVLRGVGAAIAGDEMSTSGEETGLSSVSKEEKKAGVIKEKRRPKILILNSRLDRETGPLDDPMTAVDFVRAITAACKQSQSDTGAVEDGECVRYVTHVVYLVSGRTTTAAAAAAAATEAATAAEAPENAPSVDVAELRRLGIKAVPVESQRPRSNGKNGGRSSASRKGMDRYDEAALSRALEGIIDGTLRSVYE